MEAAKAGAGARTGWSVSNLSTRERIRYLILAVLLFVVLFAVPAWLSNYWIDVLTLVAVYSSWRSGSGS